MAEYIANTSPLSYLQRAGILHIMPAVLGRVVVPGQVVTELAAGRARGYDVPDPLALPWVEVRPVAPFPRTWPRSATSARANVPC